ncbi:hypothetical protein JY651_00700 [Pyxidicoccus parkwayensis]|uniref:Uncharacterized protein n=1 Tax=Pyxidicoccus parkwayensis TaxID=2813578 RepID=A0ABX7NXS7_9BACT|nr:DUF6600 domain-containing protein [Pyxidicoccus parkwaysis]QSQ23538.1 hypothetical protein JY651_00700 [Pyxidicoccus parkwaysis]
MMRKGLWVMVLSLFATAVWAQGAPEGVPPPVEEYEATQPPQGGTPPTLDDFQQSLDPYGSWVQTSDHGPGWVPASVGPDWRPYADGRWVYTDAGWTFVSDVPWGWACFHYGRWVFEPAFGWVWLPGYQWAPAWVTWRYGAGFVAWAPLGPFDVGFGYYAAPSLWLAVHASVFDRPLIHSYFIPTANIGVVLNRTYFAGVPRRGVYFSPPVRHVEGMMGRSVTRMPVNTVVRAPPMMHGQPQGGRPYGGGSHAGMAPPREEERPREEAPHEVAQPHSAQPHEVAQPHTEQPAPHEEARPHTEQQPHSHSAPHGHEGNAGHEHR